LTRTKRDVFEDVLADDERIAVGYQLLQRFAAWSCGSAFVTSTLG
jgi:hypothetical protein